ncbi:MAG: Ig-like domain-containing protein, partial [Eubacteriales bacterium]|nr:Ig-like domain-containing protein [Eubacteriales bacterium]
ITQSNYDNGYGFAYPPRRVMLNGNDIYYASRRFNASDLTQILHTYSATPIFANDNYVITNTFVYDKNSGELLLDLPYSPDLATIIDNKVFLFDRNTNTINKYESINDLNLLTKIEVSPETITATAGQTFDLSVTAFFSDDRTTNATDRVKFTIDNPDVARISGNVVTALNAGQAIITATYQGKTSTTTLNVSAPDLLIDKMVDDNNKGLIYAISTVKYELDVISMDTLSVVSKIKFNSAPTDIELYHDSIYVSLPYEKKVAAINTTSMEVVTSYNTTSDAYSIAVEDGKLFYATQKWVSYLYELNLATGIDKLTSAARLSEPDIEIDPEKHILYIGESGSSGSDFIAISTLDYSIITQSNYDNGYGFAYPPRRVMLNGNDIYYASRRFNASDLTQILNTYSATPIFANDNYVVTNTTIYNLAGRIIAHLPNSIDLCLINEQGNFVYYINKDKCLKKYDAVDPMLVNLALTGSDKITCSINKQTIVYYTADFLDQYGYSTNPTDVVFSVYNESGEIQKGLSIDENGKLVIDGIIANGVYKINAKAKNNSSISGEISVTISNNTINSTVISQACFYDGESKLPIYKMPSNGMIEFSILTKNNLKRDIVVDVMLVLYNSDGKVIEIKKEPKLLKDLETHTFKLGVNSTQPGSYVKALVWDDKMETYCNTLVLPTQN